MKLIIDIPEDSYERIMSGLRCRSDADYIKNGTPLSESEDCVSRQAVAEVLLKYAHSTEGKAFAEFLISQINALPPVTPQHCEDVPDTNVGDIYECSCGYGWDKSKVVRHHFCPNCGRKMQEVEE